VRRNKTEDPLKLLAELASVLDGQTFVEGTSIVQKRAIRHAADELKTTLEKYIDPLGPIALICYVAGASAQAALSERANPLNALMGALGRDNSTEAGPDATLMLIVSYLARDLLAGERVE
jgi:hypothetical protein